MSSVLSAAVLAMCARESLKDARRLIEESYWPPHQPGQRAPYAAAFRSRKLAEARAIIASARKLYAHAMGRLARHGQLTHHYAETGARFRAMVRLNGNGAVWLSPRTYGKRQSAQRAAARYVEKLRMSAAVAAGVMA